MDKLSVRLEVAAKIHEDIAGQSALTATIREAAALARRVEEAQACEVVSVRPTSHLPVYELTALDGRGRPGKCGQRVRLVREE